MEPQRIRKQHVVVVAVRGPQHEQSQQGDAFHLSGVMQGVNQGVEVGVKIIGQPLMMPIKEAVEEVKVTE